MKKEVSWEGETVDLADLPKGPGYDNPEAKKLRGDIVRLPPKKPRLRVVQDNEK